MAPETETVRFKPVRRMAGKGGAAHQFVDTLRGITVDDAGTTYAVGDRVVKAFDGDGKLLRQWRTGTRGQCIALDADDRLWVGEWRQVEIFDVEGRLTDTWKDGERLGLVTAIGFGEGSVFLADATARWIRRYDREGRFLNNLGDQHRKGGFHIPNGVVDFAVGPQGIVHVANPGMHRVERYTADGELLGHFGRFDGVDPAGFGGCCNPTNVTVDSSGRVFVTEKAGPRAKVYSAGGELLTVVAADTFDPEAKNMDVAVDGQGRLYVADTAALEIRVFAPEGKGAPA